MAGLGAEFEFLDSRVIALSHRSVYAKLPRRGNSRSPAGIGCYGSILLGVFLCVSDTSHPAHGVMPPL